MHIVELAASEVGSLGRSPSVRSSMASLPSRGHPPARGGLDHDAVLDVEVAFLRRHAG
jgi:hypothetical protein